MPYSLKVKLGKLKYKGIISDKDYERLCKALKQEPCEDCISRQAVLDIVRFENRWLLDSGSHNYDTDIAFNGIISKVSDLPPVTPKSKTDTWSIKEVADTLEKHGLIREQEPCKDAISRELVLREIDKYMCGVPFEKTLDVIIKELPPVAPKPKVDVLVIVY